MAFQVSVDTGMQVKSWTREMEVITESGITCSIKCSTSFDGQPHVYLNAIEFDGITVGLCGCYSMKIQSPSDEEIGMAIEALLAELRRDKLFVVK